MKRFYKPLFWNFTLAIVATSIGSYATYSVLSNERAQVSESVVCDSPLNKVSIHSQQAPMASDATEKPSQKRKIKIANTHIEDTRAEHSLTPEVSKNPKVSKDLIDKAVNARLKKNREINDTIKGFITRNIEDESGSIVSALENKFYSESFNEEWAYDKEERISTTLENAYEQMDGIQALDISCRSTNCQVTFPIIESSKISEFYSNIQQLSNESDLGMNDPLISYFTDRETDRLIFYFSDNRNTNLFQ